MYLQLQENKAKKDFQWKQFQALFIYSYIGSVDLLLSNISYWVYLWPIHLHSAQNEIIFATRALFVEYLREKSWSKPNKQIFINYFGDLSGHNNNLCGNLPSRASEIQLSLALLVCFIMFHLKPSRTWCWLVKAYFLGQSWMPCHKTCTSSQKSTWNIYSLLAQWGKQDTIFTSPSAIIYKFYLPGATGQAPMSSSAIA